MSASKPVLTLVLALVAAASVTSMVHADDDGYRGIAALGSAGVERPYAGTRTEHSLAPVLLGRWGNFFFEGSRVMFGLHQGDGWSLAALGHLRFHQYYEPLDRERALELGAQLTVPLDAFTVQAAAYGDVTGEHDGAEFELRAFRRFAWTRVSVIPTVSVQHQSGRLAGHYFGTGAYAPGATTNVVVEAFATLDVNEDWVLVGSLRHYRHGDGIADSPLVSGRGTATWVVGIGRRF